MLLKIIFNIKIISLILFITILINGYKQSALNSGNIIGLIDKHHSTVVSDNRNYLKNILETLFYCAKQGVATKGHEDSEFLNKGNFLK